MSDLKRKSNGLKGIATGLVPQKGDSIGEIIRKIVFLVSIVVLLVMVILILNSVIKTDNESKVTESLSDLYHNSSITIDTNKREEIENKFPEVQEKFLPLLEINEDTVGWITIANSEGETIVDHPIVQCDNNSYYLTHSFEKKYSRSGAVFADFHDPITADSQPANIVLYGHNMLDNYTMFSPLINYFSYTKKDRSDISFYKEYPTITLSTLYDTSTYKIFAGMMTNCEESAGEVFDYHLVHNFASKAEFEDYCGKILDRSTFYNPEADLQYGDELVTLSTCIYGFNNSADTRWIIFGRKVRDGESETVDVEKAYVNPDPLFYDLYYAVYGGKWGGRKWDAALLKGYEPKSREE